MSKISIVVPIYNAQRWLPRFVDSLRNQSFKDFEALLVDDASTDESAVMAEAIASADRRFTLLRLPENSGGCGVPCNLGIQKAVGETICFADPDDILPENSLEVRYAAYKKNNAVVRACHDEITDDGRLLNHETRPTGLPEICRPADAAPRVGVNPFLCAHWTWLWPTALLRRNNISHGENMRTADDIVMLTRLFFHIYRLVWLPDTVYCWIKRAGSVSCTHYTPEHYANYFQCCDLFYEEAEKRKQIRLADMFFNNYLVTYQRHLLGQISDGKSDENDARLVVREMTKVAEHHKVFERCLKDMQSKPMRYSGLFRLWYVLHNQSPSVVLRLAQAQNAAAELSRDAEFDLLRQNGWSREVSFDKLDREQGLVRVRYHFFSAPPKERFLWGEAEREPAYAKNRKVLGGNDAGIFERILWLPLPQETDERCRLEIAGLASGLDHTAAEVREAFSPKPLDDGAFPVEIIALRRLARSEAVREKFEGAWLFIDKDTEADDNAEHLYRWVMRNHPETNAWFVLNEDSHDWPRLSAEGFKLVAHGGMEHGALFLLASKLVSSQMDRYIFTPLEERYFSDFERPKFICLPHGVTKDDVSAWFNGIPFDLFIAATHAEKASITDEGTPYLMTDKEVRLGGFPRYDMWLAPGKPENMLFVMPTWRADLSGSWDGKGQRRELNPDFYSSQYAKTWSALFHDPRLKRLLDAYGYRVVFFAHPGVEDYLPGMAFPDFVEKRSKSQGSIIEVMRKAKVMITDFSSVAYDMAYMNRPVVYYQYESKTEFTRSQKWVSGYVDYESMGFGPVCRTLDALIPALEEALKADGIMPAPYAERARETFAFRDANCCKRAFGFIVEASKPFVLTSHGAGREEE